MGVREALAGLDGSPVPPRITGGGTAKVQQTGGSSPAAPGSPTFPEGSDAVPQTSRCGECGRYAFAAPTVCYWCRRAARNDGGTPPSGAVAYKHGLCNGLAAVVPRNPQEIA